MFASILTHCTRLSGSGAVSRFSPMLGAGVWLRYWGNP